MRMRGFRIRPWTWYLYFSSSSKCQATISYCHSCMHTFNNVCQPMLRGIRKCRLQNWKYTYCAKIDASSSLAGCVGAAVCVRVELCAGDFPSFCVSCYRLPCSLYNKANACSLGLFKDSCTFDIFYCDCVSSRANTTVKSNFQAHH